MSPLGRQVRFVGFSRPRRRFSKDPMSNERTSTPDAGPPDSGEAAVTPVSVGTPPTPGRQASSPPLGEVPPPDDQNAE